MYISRCCSLLCALFLTAYVSAQTFNDARVKAKLTFNMARFTQWPAAVFSTPTTPLVFCPVHRSYALSRAFAKLRGLSIAGHPIEVISAPSQNLRDCHVVFMHESVDDDWMLALADISTLPVLTIGDAAGFLTNDGMVELVNVNDAVRFDVNLKALRNAQLTLSSRVLKLARHVKD